MMLKGDFQRVSFLKLRKNRSLNSLKSKSKSLSSLNEIFPVNINLTEKEHIDNCFKNSYIENANDLQNDLKTYKKKKSVSGDWEKNIFVRNTDSLKINEIDLKYARRISYEKINKIPCLHINQIALFKEIIKSVSKEKLFTKYEILEIINHIFDC